MSTITKAAVYVRISSDKAGEGLGVERQETDCRALADRLGWTVVHVYDDNDLSAVGPRPNYLRMLADIADGRIDAVLTWHVDRLYRRTVDLGPFIEIIEAANCRVETVTSGPIDLSNATGRFMARTLAGIAEYEREHAQERMIAAHKQAALSGKWRARRRVFGYLAVGKGADRTVEVVEVEAQAIRAAAADVLGGVSVAEIARRWNDAGLKSTGGAAQWNSRRIAETLQSPTYAGLAHYRNSIVGQGEWEAIIDETTHRALAGLFNGRRTNVHKPHRWQGSGVYKCGKCGGHGMKVVQGESRALEVSKRLTTDVAPFYRCPKAHLTRQQPALDAYVNELVIRRLSAPDAHLILDHTEVDLGSLRGKRDAIQSRLNDLGAMFARGEIDGGTMKSGTAQGRADLKVIDAQITTASHRDPLADLVLGEGDMRAKWSTLSAERRGKIISKLMVVTVNPTLPGRRGFDASCIDIAWAR